MMSFSFGDDLGYAVSGCLYMDMAALFWTFWSLHSSSLVTLISGPCI